MIASCGECPWEVDFLTPAAADKGLAVHRQRKHGDVGPAALPIQQLPGVSWQATFLTALAQIPVGTELTTADMHGLVEPPPHHNSWGSATAAAAHLGLIREVATQKSELATTKSSLVRRWVRTESKARVG